MTTNELILQKLEQLSKEVSIVKDDVKDIKEDVKDIKENQLPELKITDAKLLTNVGWIKTLFAIASSLIILLLGILINLAFKIIANL